MGFYDDPASVDEYIKMCEGYDGAPLYRLLAQHLVEGAALLELGVGPAIDLGFLAERYNVTASDLSLEFIQRGQEKFPHIPFVQLDALNLNLDQQFDCIYSNKVLHHFSPEQLCQSLIKQASLLADGGLIAHSFWIGDKVFEKEGMQFYFHKREALLSIIESHYQVQDTLGYGEFEEGDSLFVIASKKI